MRKFVSFVAAISVSSVLFSVTIV